MNLKTMHRRDNPETSIAAAKSILPHLSDRKYEIYQALLSHFHRTGDGMTDEELERLPQFAQCGVTSVRCRRKDLRDDGYVCDSGRKRKRPGKTAVTIWEPVAMDHLAKRLEAEARGEKPLF